MAQSTGPSEAARHVVRDAFALVAASTKGTPQWSRYRRLPAGRGVESRAVQINGEPVRRALDDARRKLAQVGIGVVEASS